jgi:hypothetical protein
MMQFSRPYLSLYDFDRIPEYTEQARKINVAQLA